MLKAQKYNNSNLCMSSSTKKLRQEIFLERDVQESSRYSQVCWVGPYFFCQINFVTKIDKRTDIKN